MKATSSLRGDGKRGRQSGFTLLELMVVIAIIGILTAMAASATLQVLGRQRVSDTKLLIKKVQSALDRAWQATIDEARKETIPPEYMERTVNQSTGQVITWGLRDMAGGNDERARVIWVKLRLKQQFPMSFCEARARAAGGLNNGPTPLAVLGSPSGSLPYFPFLLMPEVRAYEKTFFQCSVGPTPQAAESSICLLTALTQSRRGIVFDQDSLAAHELADVNVGIRIPVLQKGIVDAWGNPLFFFRWPVYSSSVAPSLEEPAFELDGSNPASAGSTAFTLRDPLDPQGTLLDPTWNNAANYNSRQGVWAFEQMLHPIHANPLAGRFAFPAAATPALEYTTASVPRAYYTVPVVVSAGKNGLLGIRGFASWQPNPMLLDPTAGEAAIDNIYSFRLRTGARGD